MFLDVRISESRNLVLGFWDVGLKVFKVEDPGFGAGVLV